MAEYFRKQCSDLNEVTSDNDDDAPNSKDVEVVEIGTGKALTMLNRLVNLKYLPKEEWSNLSP